VGDEEDVINGEEIREVEVMSENVTPRITHSFYIMVKSDSTHNFTNDHVAHKIQYELTTIKLLTVEATNGGTLICSFLCKNFMWRMKGVNCMADVFIMELNNCGMVLGI
jgi:hypothetical protein